MHKFWASFDGLMEKSTFLAQLFLQNQSLIAVSLRITAWVNLILKFTLVNEQFLVLRIFYGHIFFVFK